MAASRRAEPETLRLLAELERRAPGRPLVGTLLRLSAATGDDLDVLAEAGAVARHAVRDAELSRPIFEKLLELSAERWRAGSTDAGEDRHALAAVEELVALALAADDGVTAVDLLERGAELPAEPHVARAFRYRAAELSAERVRDASNAIALCRRILDEAPEDAATLALLSGLYAAEGKLEELLELRRRELALGPEVSRRLLLRLDIARVLGLRGGDLEVRVAALRDNLDDEPGHPDSVDALEALLLGADRAAELLGELCRQAELVQATGRNEEAAALYARAGRLASDRLGSVDRAIDAYRRSAALRPTVEVLDALAAVHQGRGEHSAAAGWLEKRLELTDAAEQETIRATVIALAAAYRASGREEQARRVLGEALARDPAAVALRELLCEIYRFAEDWALLAPLLAEAVDHVAADDERVVLLRQAAHVRRRRLGDIEAAIPLLERAASLAGEDRGVRLSLADALRAAGRFAEARALLEAMLADFG
ncbi:MAG: tetratricopeptide repeat protein, partial [Deltaproteobacteria bacterium]|nr:tetratricopeptide repeat protein [Deltaproteobacteria bacterium]